MYIQRRETDDSSSPARNQGNPGDGLSGTKEDLPHLTEDELREIEENDRLNPDEIEQVWGIVFFFSFLYHNFSLALSPSPILFMPLFHILNLSLSSLSLSLSLSNLNSMLM